MSKNLSLYEINTPVYLNRLSTKLKRRIRLADVPDSELKRLADLGVEAIWLMGVWERSPAAIAIGDSEPETRARFRSILHDITPEDVIGSAYSVRHYAVAESLGGRAGLAALRQKLRAHNIGLVLDFVPNHTAPDHSWIAQQSEVYIRGKPKDYKKDPVSFIELGSEVFARGRDPQYPAWSDVVQLNAFSPAYRQAAIDTLQSIAVQCDGVRCDMAMLMMNDIFANTWKKRAGKQPKAEFWEQIITATRVDQPDFMFLAEAYWDTEQALIRQGFDYCYDKTLYDRLLEDDGAAVNKYLQKTASFQPKLVHFIENHDEDRAAAVYRLPQEKAAAAIVAMLPGIRFFHDGQFEGRKVTLPVHLGRGPAEKLSKELQKFYDELLGVIVSWQGLAGDWKFASAGKQVVASEWTIKGVKHVAIVNYCDTASKVELNFKAKNFSAAKPKLTDALSDQSYALEQAFRNKQTLKLKLEPWQILLLSEHAN